MQIIAAPVGTMLDRDDEQSTVLAFALETDAKVYKTGEDGLLEIETGPKLWPITSLRCEHCDVLVGEYDGWFGLLEWACDPSTVEKGSRVKGDSRYGYAVRHIKCREEAAERMDAMVARLNAMPSILPEQ